MTHKSKGRTWAEAAASGVRLECALVFKGRVCGYTGPYTVCDRTLACCQALGNTDSYAGLPAPAVPTIQERVATLGLLVHTSYMDGRWMAWDDRTYDGAPWQLGMGRSEDQAILELLSQIENQRYEEEDLP